MDKGNLAELKNSPETACFHTRRLLTHIAKKLGSFRF